MEVAEVSRTKFDPYVIGNNIRDINFYKTDANTILGTYLGGMV